MAVIVQCSSGGATRFVMHVCASLKGTSHLIHLVHPFLCTKQSAKDTQLCMQKHLGLHFPIMHVHASEHVQHRKMPGLIVSCCFSRPCNHCLHCLVFPFALQVQVQGSCVYSLQMWSLALWFAVSQTFPPPPNHHVLHPPIMMRDKKCHFTITKIACDVVTCIAKPVNLWTWQKKHVSSCGACIIGKWKLMMNLLPRTQIAPTNKGIDNIHVTKRKEGSVNFLMEKSDGV